MGIEGTFKKVKLFCGLIYRSESVFEEIRKKLETVFSAVDLEIGPLDFDFTTYYNDEMGMPLFRRFLSFGALIRPEELPGIKILTNVMEMESTVNGSRVINLDPGYLSEANVIIATTKNHFHRVPLSKGIYAHMEYIRKGKNLEHLEWTYPDFKSDPYMEFFNRMIPIYKQALKSV